MCRPEALLPERAALQGSKESAERELAILKQREQLLLQVILQEEERLQVLKQEQEQLGHSAEELLKQEVCAQLLA